MVPSTSILKIKVLTLMCQKTATIRVGPLHVQLVKKGSPGRALNVIPVLAEGTLEHIHTKFRGRWRDTRPVEA